MFNLKLSACFPTIRCDMKPSHFNTCRVIHGVDSWATGWKGIGGVKRTAPTDVTAGFVLHTKQAWALLGVHSRTHPSLAKTGAHGGLEWWQAGPHGPTHPRLRETWWTERTEESQTNWQSRRLQILRVCERVSSGNKTRHTGIQQLNNFQQLKELKTPLETLRQLNSCRNPLWVCAAKRGFTTSQTTRYSLLFHTLLWYFSHSSSIRLWSINNFYRLVYQCIKHFSFKE